MLCRCTRRPPIPWLNILSRRRMRKMRPRQKKNSERLAFNWMSLLILSLESTRFVVAFSYLCSKQQKRINCCFLLIDNHETKQWFSVLTLSLIAYHVWYTQNLLLKANFDRLTQILKLDLNIYICCVCKNSLFLYIRLFQVLVIFQLNKNLCSL